MRLREVAPADLTPVLGEFAAHLRLGFGFADDGAEDALLLRYLGSAIAAIEAETAQALLARDFVLRVPGWDRRGQLVLPIGPVAEIEAISFLRGGEVIPVEPARWALMPGRSRQLLTGAGGGGLAHCAARGGGRAGVRSRSWRRLGGGAGRVAPGGADAGGFLLRASPWGCAHGDAAGGGGADPALAARADLKPARG